MNFADLSIAIRPRRDWEAVDLGIHMARRWWWPMTKVWCLLTLPLLLLALVLPVHWLPWLPLILWWLKPLFERPLLLLLSRGVFAEHLSTREVIKGSASLFIKQIMPSLTWRRLSPHRAMDLAVMQLEGLSGHERKARLNVLHREGDAPAKWLTIIGVHLESFMMLALLSLLPVFIPSELQLDIFDLQFWFASRWGLFLQLLSYYLAVAVVAPFYVACGFSLYLNRRIKLEGWDIEIAFKQMLSKRGLAPAAGALLLCFASFTLGFHAEPSFAQTAEPGHVAEEAEQVRAQVQEVLASEDFQQTHQQKVLRFKTREEQPAKDAPVSFAWLRQLGAAIAYAMSAIAAIGEVILWAVVLGAALYLAIKYRSLVHSFARWQRPRRQFQPETVMGMDVRPESLPRDVSASAEQLWQQQQARAALALLYRASLAMLLQRGLPLRAGSTENECLQLARGQTGESALPAPLADYFVQLTRSWQQLAYAHCAPQEAEALQLCRQWNSLWHGSDNGR